MHKSRGDALHREFLTQVKNGPKIVLEAILRRKIKATGVKRYRKIAKELATQIWEQRDYSLDSFPDLAEQGLSIGKEDLEELEGAAESLKEEMPNLLKKASASASSTMLDGYRESWKAYRPEEAIQFANFKHNLQRRWGKGLDALRMLLDLSRDVGTEFHNKIKRFKKRRNSPAATALSRLHCRACQVTSEIILLLENGYADGAMARWRTLHEICVVALVIEDGGDEVAQRYFDHSAVDSKRALDLYQETHKLLGFEPPSQNEVDAVNSSFQQVIAYYGAEFASQFGWASTYLNNKAPRFTDLEKAADRVALRSYYKMASYNVHASSKSLSIQLGLPDHHEGTLAGASNVGLEEPGQNTAFGLLVITSLLLKPIERLDDMAFAQGLITLRDEAVEAFTEQARILEKDVCEGSSKARRRS